MWTDEFTGLLFGLMSIGVLFFIIRYYKKYPTKEEVKTFKKKRVPVVGEEWGFTSARKNNNSPWAKTETSEVTVTIWDVQDEWVRYYHGKSKGGFNDYAKPIEEFLRIFEPLHAPDRCDCGSLYVGGVCTGCEKVMEVEDGIAG